jgi:hypothetical protein
VKTTISIPDAIFKEAEALARRRGMSRSHLYATAVAEYIKCARILGVGERLNALYATSGDESELDAQLAAMQSQLLYKKNW